MLPRAMNLAARVYLILAAFAAAIAAVEDTPDVLIPAADCSPKDPLLATSTTLQLNCTLNLPLSRQIICKFAAEILQTTVIDNRTFQVTRENVTRNMSHGHVFCHVNASGKLSQIAQVAIRVADIPTAPTITGCVVYNWERMVCTWDEPLDNGLPTNYTLGWSVLVPDYHKCPHPSGNTCEWERGGVDGLRMTMDYYLKMHAENALRSVFSQPYHYLPTDIVKPNPVTSLTAVDITKVSAVLRWTWHDSSHTERPLIFQISYNSQWDTDNVTKETINHSITLVDLLPYTNYSVYVACKYYFNNEHKGFWSNKTSFNFRTNESVPSLAPSVAAGGYLVRGVDKKERSVDVFWKPLHGKFLQGQLKHYRLRYFNAGDGRRFHEYFEVMSETVPYFHRNKIPLDLDISVTVEAETNEGRNESLKLETILIPRTGKELPKPDIFYAIGYNSEIVVSWSPVLNASGYTVYWCKRDPSGECENSLNWTSVPLNITNFTLSIVHSKFREFFVAISVETYDEFLQRVVSSGLVKTECVHDSTNDVLIPENFNATQEQHAYSFTVEWKKPNCQKTAYILGYELLYCKRQACDEPICCRENRTLNISNNKLTFAITNLEEDVEYVAWIRSRSLSRVSQFSNPARHFVFRSGLSAGIIVAIVIAALVLMILMTVGLVSIAKNVKKSCCHEIKIVPPPLKVIANFNSSDQGLSSAGYLDRQTIVFQNEETHTLLENSIVKNGHVEQQYAKTSGNVEHPDDESSHPFVHAAHEDEDDLRNMEVEPANDSSISPYTHVAVSATNEPTDLNDANRLSSSDVVSCDPASYIFPHIDTNILNSELESPIQSYVPAGQVPSSSNSSSMITPYTTIEQTAAPDIARLLVNTDSGNYVRPGASEGMRCQNGVTKISDAKDDSGVQVELCERNDVAANFQPTFTNLHEVSDENGCSEYVSGTNVLISAKTLLPVGYIPVAPILSS